MPLSINPTNISSVSDLGSGLTSALNQAGSGPIGLNSSTLKANLDATVNRISGGIGSGLNGISAGSGVTNNLSNVVQSSPALGGISSITNNIGSITSATALAAGALGAVSKIAAGGLGTGLTAAAGLAATAASIAGLANDLISQARSKNLPTNLPSFSQPEDVVKVYPTKDGDWRVRISAPLGWGEIIFPVIPSMQMGFRANYGNTDLVHTNYQFLAYKNSAPDDIQISCEWPVETVKDGQEYLQMILLGRTLTKMFYGYGDNVGQPPPICTLQGFSISGFSTILPPTPVVVKSFSSDIKDDVSYLQVDNDYVPRLSSISITVAPLFSRSAQRAFNLDQYRNANNVITY